jgi:hypothetical protein
MEKAGPTSITSKKLLAVEGLDEKNFFEKFLMFMDIHDVQIEDVGGKIKFVTKFPALLNTPGFYNPDQTPRVTHVAIIRDKDEDNAFESVKNIVSRAGPKPPQGNAQFSDGTPLVGIFIMPGPKVKGNMLEDLCLKSVQSHPATGCVDSFADCISKLPKPPKNMSKAKVQSFLAAQPEIVTSLGLGAQNDYWDFTSSAFEELKAFLNHLK